MKNWRKTLQKRKVKFDDDKKQIYLEQLLKHGMKGMAAEAADISYTTVQEHRENDPEFAEAELAALEMRSNAIVEQIEEEALAGFKEPIVNKDGKVVAHRKRYESGIRSQILKAHGGELYKDKSDINLNGGAGGVLLLSPEVGMDDFLKQADAVREQMLEDKAKDLDDPSSNTE